MFRIFISSNVEYYHIALLLPSKGYASPVTGSSGCKPSSSKAYSSCMNTDWTSAESYRGFCVYIKSWFFRSMASTTGSNICRTDPIAIHQPYFHTCHKPLANRIRIGSTKGMCCVSWAEISNPSSSVRHHIKAISTTIPSLNLHVITSVRTYITLCTWFFASPISLTINLKIEVYNIQCWERMMLNCISWFEGDEDISTGQLALLFPRTLLNSKKERIFGNG